MNSARPSLEYRWVLSSRSVRIDCHGEPGKICSLVIVGQMCESRLAPPAGSEAKNAPLRAPTDVPTIRSGVTPYSDSACNMPTWAAPRLAPPPMTKAIGPGRSKRPLPLALALPFAAVESVPEVEELTLEFGTLPWLVEPLDETHRPPRPAR